MQKYISRCGKGFLVKSNGKNIDHNIHTFCVNLIDLSYELKRTIIKEGKYVKVCREYNRYNFHEEELSYYLIYDKNTLTVSFNRMHEEDPIIKIFYLDIEFSSDT